jgi:hypothetical protein
VGVTLRLAGNPLHGGNALGSAWQSPSNGRI